MLLLFTCIWKEITGKRLPSISLEIFLKLSSTGIEYQRLFNLSPTLFLFLSPHLPLSGLFFVGKRVWLFIAV